MRLIDTSKNQSLGFLWGYVVPEEPRSASKLSFIGALKNEQGGRERLLDFSAFPDNKDTKYTVQGEKTLLHQVKK